MGEPSSSPSDGTPGSQTPTMLSIYLERSQTSQSQTSEPEQTPVCRPRASASAAELQLMHLGPAFSTEATAGGPSPATSGAVTTGQGPYLRAAGQTLSPPQSYIVPQQPQTAALPATISDASGATPLSLLPRQPGATFGYQAPRTPAAAAHFSPSSSAISLPSTAAEDLYADPGEPSSSAGPGQARGISAEELAAMDPKRAKRLIANRQSAQRSKARKLRHIMQLEDEVQSLQGITTQQQARLGALQQENSLLSTSNQQLAIQAGELQSQVGSYEAFAEACLQELRRLSLLAGEPFQLPALPQAAPQVQEPQMGAQVPVDQLAASEMALHQQLAAQGRLPGAIQYPIMAQQPGLPQAQELPGAYAGQPAGTPRMGAQRASGPVNLSSSYPPVYAQPMGRGLGLAQRGGRHQRVGSAGAMHPQGVPSGLAQGFSLEARQPSKPLPQRAGSGQIEGGEAGAGGDAPSGPVQEAARQALAMAERHRMHSAGEQPQLDAGQAAIAAAEARRAAMSAEGRGQPLQRGMSQSIAREEAGRVAAQLPGMRPDPFRTIVPASAFRMEEHGSAGSQDTPQTPGRRHGQPAQQLPAMPEQQAMIDMSQWPTGQPMGWPLGPRAQQPYPAVSVSSVGSVMQAFRGLNVHQSSDPTGYALTPRGAFAPQHSRMQSQLPLLQGRYPNLSWDEMLRSLSDPIYQYDAQGNPSFSQGLYPHATQISRATYDMFYNPEQQQQPPSEEGPGQQPPH